VKEATMAKKIKPAAGNYIDEEYQRVALVVDAWWGWTGEYAIADLCKRLLKFVRKVEREAERRGRKIEAARRRVKA
jgi:hypothetical protein